MSILIYEFLMKLWPGYWYNQSQRINMRVDEDNGRDMGT